MVDITQQDKDETERLLNLLGQGSTTGRSVGPLANPADETTKLLGIINSSPQQIGVDSLNDDEETSKLLDIITPQSRSLVESTPIQEPTGQVQQSTRLTDLTNLFEEVKRDYTQTDEDGTERVSIPLSAFTEDERVTRLMDEVQTTRWGSGEYGVIGTAGSYIVSATGAATARGWMDKTPEERLNVFQNYQRKLAGGHSVTTANELAAISTMSDEDKAILGIGYQLFDATPSIFSGETSWGEMFDGLWDYGRAAVIDPVTVASLGVGKALGAGGSKAASFTIQQAGRRAYQQALASNATRAVAETAARTAMNQVYTQGTRSTIGSLAAYSAVDLAAGIGIDIAYQSARIQTDAQEEYSAAQTGLAALGTIAIPALVGAVRGARNVYRGVSGIKPTENIDMKFALLGDDALRQQALQNVNWNQVSGWLTDAFKNVKDNMPKNADWQAAITAARNSTEATDLDIGDNLFFKLLLVGDDTIGVKSVPQAMQEAGFVFRRRTPDDNVTNYISDAIRLLPENTVRMMVDSFENAAGTKLNLITRDTVTNAVLPLNESLARTFSKRSSDLGTNMQYTSAAASVLRQSGNPTIRLGDVEVADYLTAIENGFLPVSGKSGASTFWNASRFTQAQIKKAMTSHIATTASNIRGWGALFSLNSISQLIHGALLSTDSLLRGDSLKSGAGLIRGAIYRGYYVLDPNAATREAEGIFNVMPEVGRALNSVLAGDSGFSDILARQGLNPNSKLLNATEATTNFLQSVTGVKLQHEVTTNISFMSAYQTNLLREYGEDYAKFLSSRTPEEAMTEMFSPRFVENVLSPAVYQAKRETASLSFADMGPAHRLSLRPLAAGIESLSNAPVTGLMIPFGRFFNNTMAFLGDFSGLNLAVHSANRIANATGLNSAAIKAGDEEFYNLVAKTAVGWAGVLTYSHAYSEDRVREGYAYNQEHSSDGGVIDKTYDWPESAWRIVGHWLAHKRIDGEVPEELAREAATVLVGQTFRSLDDGGKALYSILETVTAGDLGATGDVLIENASGIIGRTMASATRFLDPVNQLAVFATDQNRAPDRRAGITFYNEALRNVDGIFGLRGSLPERQSPTRISAAPIDLGKQLGVRTGEESTLFERMLARNGRPNWTVDVTSGPPEIRNAQNRFFSNYVNLYAQRAFNENPGYFELPLRERQFIVDSILRSAREDSVNSLRNLSLQSEDRVLGLIYDINSKIPKRDLADTLKTLGLSEDLMDIVDQPNAEQQLELILNIGQNLDNFLESSINARR